MFAWWNRLVEKMHGTTPTTHDSHSTAAPAASVAVRPWAGLDFSGISRGWQRLTTKRPRTDTGTVLPDARPLVDAPAAPAGTMDAVLSRLSRLCETFESHLVRQQSRTEEIAGAISRLATELSCLPSMSAEQKRRMEQLTAAVTAHHEETTKLGSLIGEVPALLQRNTEAITHEVTALGQAQAHIAGRMETVADDVRRVCEASREATSAMTGYLQQHLSIEREMTSTVQNSARRLTILLGVAIGVASASASFGVIQLFTRLGVG